MSEHRISWPEIAWQAGNHPLERKKVAPGPCTLLRFGPGFADPNVCLRSHVLHVLEGTLTVALGDAETPCAAGESFVLPPGTAHQVRNDTDRDVVLLAISDLTWPGA
jgi:gentisate 1,2-dioxygenase